MDILFCKWTTLTYTCIKHSTNMSLLATMSDFCSLLDLFDCVYASLQDWVDTPEWQSYKMLPESSVCARVMLCHKIIFHCLNLYRPTLYFTLQKIYLLLAFMISNTISGAILNIIVWSDIFEVINDQRNYERNKANCIMPVNDLLPLPVQTSTFTMMK